MHNLCPKQWSPFQISSTQRWSAAVAWSSTPLTVFSEPLLVAPGLHVDSKMHKSLHRKAFEAEREETLRRGI